MSTQFPSNSPQRLTAVQVKTADYTIVLQDDATLLVMNSSAAHTFKVPATPPARNGWFVYIVSIGTGTTTINRNGNNIDGAASNVTLTQNQGLLIGTDGTSYYTERGVSAAAVTFETNSTQNGSQTLLNLIAGSGISLSESSGAVTITNTGVTGTSTKLYQYPPKSTLTGSNQATMNYTGSSIAGGANTICLFGIEVYMPVAASKLIIDIIGADATGGDKFDFGLYDTNGNQIFNIGAASYTTTGTKTLSFAQGAITIQPGFYWFAVTGNNTNGLQFHGFPLSSFGNHAFIVSNNAGNQKWFHSATASSGGALPATITAPSPTAASNLEWIDGGNTNAGGADVPMFILTGY